MRILVVEDEHKIAQALRKGLEQESFAVDVAFDGDQGLIEVENEDYDLVILDRMMPGEVDGLGILQAMRKNQDHTPVIFLTAKDTIEDRVTGLNEGADDYLIKPFSFDELLARVRALLRRPKDSLEAELTYDDVRLNTVTYDVMRGDTRIKLSSKEFALLEYLLRNPERIITKDMIMRHVWDYDSDILPNTVEVYIGYLRAKIDKPFPKRPRLIQTVRGFGYKLEVES